MSKTKLTFGSLFAGIGGFDLGFERAGMVCKWQVEIDPYCQKVLAKHWPDVRRHDDVRTFPAEPIDQWQVDVICGGFPCQDIALPGSGDGLDGEQSQLWHDFARVLGVLRPRFAVVENSPALTIRGLDKVLGCLADIGFDAEWDCIPAAAFGAHHERNRIYLVAWPAGTCAGLFSLGDAGTVHRSGGVRQRRSGGRRDAGRVHRLLSTRMDTSGSDTASERLEIGERVYAWRQETDAPAKAPNWWHAQPGVMRVAAGVPNRIQRTKALGNSVMPHIAQWIGERITALAAEAWTTTNPIAVQDGYALPLVPLVVTAAERNLP